MISSENFAVPLYSSLVILYYKPCCYFLELVAVDGKWGAWEPWSNCTKPCGVGEINRFRHCNQPVPKYGGKQCVGGNVENEACNTEPCPGTYET